MHSFRKAQQPGPVTRLLNCTDEEKKNYKGVDAPTLEVPSMRRHPKTGDWYPARNKPAGVVHWLKHKLGAERGRPVAAYYGYSVRCDNILAKLHTEHPEVCNKVGGLLAMHIDGLRVLAHLWLSKTEEVPEDQAHWETNITGDIYGEGWISEILPFSVGNRSFSKLEHHEDGIVYDCRQLFPKPPYPREVKAMELDPNKRRGMFLSIECINTMNEGLLLQHARHGCPMPKWSKYLSFLKSKTFVELTHPKLLTPRTVQTEVAAEGKEIRLMHSFHLSGQPENITRLLSCTDEDLKQYKGHDLPPTRYVPSMSHHPLDVLLFSLELSLAAYIVILDADMILRGPITPWEFKPARDRWFLPLTTCKNSYSITPHPDACDKVGGVIVMHIDDLWAFVLLWWISEMYGHSFGAAELRHRISSEILIYPGYVPQPDVQYRVFHYDLEFKVGTWSFDKANWREVDMVNSFWAMFPDPPDPSTPEQIDEN
ncbi:hypothetical protein GOBAR_AA00458 [Gossypium barbadense]|uniref:Uncharacterized protein n=1 Tax=Gossypium barbadense TaxID=3634 RepID=A0A2P5YWV1_GOSBA|nr:hypothetical protein GOBAR_AA00458 [Gossypium barbadense]